MKNWIKDNWKICVIILLSLTTIFFFWRSYHLAVVNIGQERELEFTAKQLLEKTLKCHTVEECEDLCASNQRISIDYSNEKRFDKPIDITWKGKVASFFASGNALNIEKIPEDKEHPHFFAQFMDDRMEPEWMHQIVIIKGKWIGITCAYARTIFGQCVPEIKIEKITSHISTPPEE